MRKGYRRFFHDFLLTAGLLIAGLPAFAADPLAVRYHEDAIARFNNGDLKGAEIQLKNSLTRDPTQLPARMLMGQVQLKLGNAQHAEEELELAIKLGADPAIAALPLARARNRLGKHKLNIEKLVPTALPLRDQPDLWVELGIARMKDKDADGAKIAFKQALAIMPLHAGATVGMAQVPLQAGDYAEALRLAEVAVGNAPDNSQAWFVKAAALHALGENRAAAAAYGRARDLDPNDVAAGLGEATALLDDEKPARAAALLEKLRASHPWIPEVPYLQSKALQALGKTDEAAAALTSAGELLDPIPLPDLSYNPALLRLVGMLALDKGQNERAYQAVDLYLKGRPEDTEARKLFARIALAMNKSDEAKRSLVPLVTAGQADAEILGLLGDANAQEHDFITAESYYREALNKYRGGPLLAGRLGALQYRQGQRQEALDNLQDLARSNPTGTTLGVSLYAAMLSFAEGELDVADEITTRMLRDDPGNLLALNLEAALAIARGRYADARRLLGALRVKAPEFRPARYNAAKLAMLEEQYDEAADILNGLLAETPDDQRALMELGRLARSAGDQRAALKHYERLRQLNPASLVAMIELVDLYLAESRDADAMNAALELNRALPQNFHAHITLARVQLAQRQLDDARATAGKAALSAGYDPRQLLQAAALQQQLAAYDDAGRTLTRLLEERPDSVAGRRLLAEVLVRRGALEDADQQLDTLLDEHPRDLAALALRGDVAMARGQFQAAAEAYADALVVEARPAILVSRFRARTLAGEADAALHELSAWQAGHPDDPAVLRALAERHHQLGQLREALPLYERLITALPDDANVINNFANLLLEIDTERAFKTARRALALQPDNPAILDTMGWSLVQIGDLEQGISHLRNAVARSGRSAILRYHLGVALEEYGSHDEARRQLREAMQLAGNAAAPWIDDARLRLQRLN